MGGETKRILSMWRCYVYWGYTVCAWGLHTKLVSCSFPSQKLKEPRGLHTKLAQMSVCPRQFSKQAAVHFISGAFSWPFSQSNYTQTKASLFLSETKHNRVPQTLGENETADSPGSSSYSFVCSPLHLPNTNLLCLLVLYK